MAAGCLSDAIGRSETNGGVTEQHQLLLRFSDSWDPYEVWCTRVRGTLAGGNMTGDPSRG